MNKITLIISGLIIQQTCYPSEKIFDNVHKSLALSSSSEQYFCHALGLFSAGLSKSYTKAALVGVGLDFVACPIMINGFKWGKTKIKHFLLNHTEPQKPTVHIKKK